MQDYSKKIDELKTAVSRNDDTIDKQLTLLGERLVAVSSEQVEGSALEAEYTTAVELLKEKSEHQEKIDKITDCRSRLERIALDMKDNRSAVKEQNELMEPHLEEIGRVAYEVFKQRRDEAEKFYPIFADLVETEAKINGIEQDVEVDQEEPQPGFFGKIRRTGKRLFKEGVVRTKRRYLERQYRPAGSRLVESDFHESFPSIELEKVMEPVLAVKARLSELQNEYRELEERHDEVEDSLREIVSMIPNKAPVVMLEKRISELDETLADTYRRMGVIYRDSGLAGTIGGPKFEGSLKIIRHLLERNESYEHLIRRLEAAVEVKNLEERKGDAESRIRGKEDSIRRLQEEMAGIRDEIDQIEIEMKTMADIRGSEETLLSEGHDEAPNGKSRTE